MAVTSSSAVTLSTTAERTSLATAASDTTSIAKTPDYHLPWTGVVVEDAIQKAIDLDPNDVGGVKVIESTSTDTANLDGIVDPGEYTAKYVSASGLPEALEGVTPVKLTVYTKDGVLYQVVEGMGDVWTRFSTDDGDTWSAWSPKPTNSGGIDISGDPETPKDDPFEALQDQVSKLEAVAGGAISFGTAEDGAAMLAGTYDWSATDEQTDDQTSSDT